MAILWGIGGDAAAFAADLERALKGRKITGSAFHEVLRETAKKHGKTIDAKETVVRTIGDRHGIVLWLGTWSDRELIFLWPEKGRNRAQWLDRGKDRGWLTGPFYYQGDTLRAAGNGYAGGNWSWPSLYVFRLVEGRWRTVQIMNSDEEATRCRRIREVDFAMDPNRFHTAVRAYPKHLSSCHACAHLHFAFEWRFRNGKFVQTGRALEPTAFAKLDELAGWAQRNRRKDFDRDVARSTRESLWRVLRGAGPNSGGPQVDDATNITDDHATSFLLSDEWRVSLANSNGRWRAVGLTRIKK